MTPSPLNDETAPAIEPHRACLLVVDDQPANIQAVYQIFSGQHQVLMATNGEQALTLCLKTPPDLILLDVVMPGMDGLETCRRLKALDITRNIPVIFVTGGSRVEEENECWEVGAIDFVSKPINPATLRNRVRAHLILKQQTDLLRLMAFRDGLTGVSNRRYFDDRYNVEWRRAQRAGSALSVIMIDVDHFKLYNDHYGHAEGDKCLRMVASELNAQLNRPADLLARYGGEEFVCILPDTDLNGARITAERMRLSVEKIALPHAASLTSSCVTISIGIATMEDKVSEDLAPVLVDKADEQLYIAKRSGRNRISSECLVSSEL